MLWGGYYSDLGKFAGTIYLAGGRAFEDFYERSSRYGGFLRERYQLIF